MIERDELSSRVRQRDEDVALKVGRDLFVELFFGRRRHEIRRVREAIREGYVLEHLPAQRPLADVLKAFPKRHVAFLGVVAVHKLRLEGVRSPRRAPGRGCHEAVELEEGVLERGRREHHLPGRPDRFHDAFGRLRALVDAAQPVGLVDDHEIPSDLLNQIALRVNKLDEQMTMRSSITKGFATPFFASALAARASRMAEGRKNFSSSSTCHCFRNVAGTMSRIRRRRSAHFCARTREASIVLPRPTSSARRTPLIRGAQGEEGSVDLVRVEIDTRVADGPGQGLDAVSRMREQQTMRPVLGVEGRRQRPLSPRRTRPTRAPYRGRRQKTTPFPSVATRCSWVYRRWRGASPRAPYLRRERSAFAAISNRFAVSRARRSSASGESFSAINTARRAAAASCLAEAWAAFRAASRRASSAARCSFRTRSSAFRAAACLSFAVGLTFRRENQSEPGRRIVEPPRYEPPRRDIEPPADSPATALTFTRPARLSPAESPATAPGIRSQPTKPS